jgi:ABC-type transport system involved in Fe-S cluster assembly fused permease/ATPase subunit
MDLEAQVMVPVEELQLHLVAKQRVAAAVHMLQVNMIHFLQEQTLALEVEQEMELQEVAEEELELLVVVEEAVLLVIQETVATINKVAVPKKDLIIILHLLLKVVLVHITKAAAVVAAHVE